MNVIGFTKVKEKWREGGKMVYYLYQKQQTSTRQDTTHFSKKQVLRTGSRNNFAILLNKS
jgi:25S rRNA (adenine2142-N1)-methyltransferase